MTKPRRTASSYTLLVGVLGLLVVAGWTAYQVYSSVTKSQITQKQALNIAPLEGAIRKDNFANLDARRKFTPADFSSVVLNRISTESGMVR
jgi:hypothetical protein